MSGAIKEKVDDVGLENFGDMIEVKSNIKQCVIIAGMQGSGTSLCSSIAQKLGIDMVMDNNPGVDDHETGSWERLDLVKIHDEILASFGQCYDSLESLPAAWWRDPNILLYKKELIEKVQELNKGGAWGFKDCRTTRLFPLWHDILNDQSIQMKVIFCVRNPEDVAMSLATRDGFDMDFSKLLWLRYHTDFFNCGLLDKCLVLKYEDWFDASCVNMTKLMNYLEVGNHVPELVVNSLLSETVLPGLRRNNNDLTYDYCSFVYKKMLEFDFDSNNAELINIFSSLEFLNKHYGNIFKQSNLYLKNKEKIEKYDYIVEDFKCQKKMLDIRLESMGNEVRSLRAEHNDLLNVSNGQEQTIRQLSELRDGFYGRTLELEKILKQKQEDFLQDKQQYIEKNSSLESAAQESLVLISKFQTQIEVLESQLQGIQQHKNQTQETEYSLLQEERASYLQTIEELKQVVLNEREEISGLHTQLNELREVYAKHQQEFSELDELNRQNQSKTEQQLFQVRELERALHTAQARLQEQEKELAADVKDRHEHLDRIARLEEERQRTQQRVGELQEHCDGMSDNVAQLQQELQTQTAQATAKQEELTDLLAEQARQTQTIESLKHVLDEERAEMFSLRGELKELREEHVQQSKAFFDLEGTNRQEKSKNEKLVLQLQILEQDLQASQTKITDQQKELTANVEDRHGFLEKVVALEATQNQLRSEVEIGVANQSKLQEQLREEQKIVCSLRDKLNIVNEIHDKLHAEATQLSQERQFLLEDIVFLFQKNKIKNESQLHFHEQQYLALYPDVAEAISAKKIRSGMQHWLQFGFKEGRMVAFTRIPPTS